MEKSQDFSTVSVQYVSRHDVLLNHKNSLKADKHLVSTVLLSDPEGKQLVQYVPQPPFSSFVPIWKGTSFWVRSDTRIFQNAKVSRRICVAELKCHTTCLTVHI